MESGVIVGTLRGAREDAIGLWCYRVKLIMNLEHG